MYEPLAAQMKFSLKEKLIPHLNMLFEEHVVYYFERLIAAE